jgi:hypothetical protein
MQKKFYLSALAILAAFGMTAKHVTPEEAMARATASGSAKAPAAVKMTCAKTFTTSNNVDALYIFKGGNNALVLPADDRVAPILGYFDGPTEGEMPEQLKWWLSEYVNQIEFLQSQPETSGSAAAPSYASSTETREAIAPMLTTKWNQSAPYNNQCPVDATTNETSVTGCVATAAAQVMNYYKYPTDALSGTIDYTDYGQDTTNGTARSLNIDGKKFDWANMLDRYTTGNYTDEQADAVAFLMAACGYAAQMNYTSDESGAISLYSLIGAKKYFGYNDKATFLSRNLFTLSDWEDLLYRNLQTVGPLFYDGDNNSSGHAFVCDGYSDGYFHFNWGWDGSYNGYFLTTALTPAGSGIGGNSSHYSYNQDAIFNFTAPDAETISLPEFCPITLQGSLTGYILTDEKTNKPYLCLFSDKYTSSSSNVFVNMTDKTVKLNILLKIEDLLSATSKTYVYYEDDLPPCYGATYVPIDCTKYITSAGKYRFSLQYSEDKENWVSLSHGPNCSDYIDVTFDSDINITDIETPSYPVATVEQDSFKAETALYWGKNFKYTFSMKNNTENYVSDYIIPAILAIPNSASTADFHPVKRNAASASVAAQGAEVAVNLAPGEEFTFEGTSVMAVSSSVDTSDATLYFGLVSKNNGSLISNYGPITVATATDPELSASAFSINTVSTEAVDPSNLSFSYTVSNSTGYYCDNIVVAITQDGKSFIALLNSDPVVLNANDTVNGTITGSLENTEPETVYYAILCSRTTSYNQLADAIKFKTAKTITGLSAVNDGKGGTRIVADRSAGLVSVSAASDIRAVQLYALDGRKLAPAVSINGAAATIDMSQLPAGVSLVKVTLSDGSTAISKIIK